MLRAMHRVMELERPWVEGNLSLEAAHKEGIRYWRDHFGRIGLKELYARVVRGDLIGAIVTLGGLIRYAGLELLVLPWKYRRRILRKLRVRFGR